MRNNIERKSKRLIHQITNKDTNQIMAITKTMKTNPWNQSQQKKEKKNQRETRTELHNQSWDKTLNSILNDPKKYFQTHVDCYLHKKNLQQTIKID